MNTKELALHLSQDLKLKVFPCYPIGHENAKKPKTAHGQKDATNVEGVVLNFFGGPAPKLIGLPCKDNGFFAVDVDTAAAAETWAAWCKEFGMAEPGPWQKTPHGAHYLFKFPDFDFTGAVGKLAPGMDLRADNYICTGEGYEWMIPLETGIPEAPEWLQKKIKAVAAVTTAERSAPSTGPILNPDLTAAYWLKYYAARAELGKRNQMTYNLGLQLYYAGASLDLALSLWPEWLRSIPYSAEDPFTQGEYIKTIKSAYSGIQREAATLPREVRQAAAAPVPALHEQAGPGAPPIDNMGVENVTNERNNIIDITAGHMDPEPIPAKIESEKAAAKPKVSKEPVPEPKPEKSAEFSTWADLDAVLGPIEWEWPGWLAKGFLHILVGEVGGGKSSIALRIGRTYLTGLAWPDGTQYNGAHGCILWGEAEAAQAMNRDRAKFMDLPTDKILSPLGDPLGDFRLNNRDHQTKLTIMAMKPEVKLIVIDSLSGADPTAEKSTEDAKNVNWLAALARDIQKPIILTHHLRKRGMFDTEGIVSLDRVRGISTILQYARVIWAIEAPDREAPDAKRLSVIKSNIAKKPDPIGFIIDDEIVFGPAPENPRAETAKDRGIEALRELLSRGEVAASQIENDFKGLALSKRAMYEAKKALVVISVKKADGWYWRLPVKKENGFYG